MYRGVVDVVRYPSSNARATAHGFPLCLHAAFTESCYSSSTARGRESNRQQQQQQSTYNNDNDDGAMGRGMGRQRPWRQQC